MAEFAYDALGRRIRKKDLIADETTLYYYNNNWQVLSETDAGGTVMLQSELTDAEVIRKLKKGRSYTYLLPLELWIAILVIGVLLLIVVAAITRLRRRKLAIILRKNNTIGI